MDNRTQDIQHHLAPQKKCAIYISHRQEHLLNPLDLVNWIPSKRSLHVRFQHEDLWADLLSLYSQKDIRLQAFLDGLSNIYIMLVPGQQSSQGRWHPNKSEETVKSQHMKAKVMLFHKGWSWMENSCTCDCKFLLKADKLKTYFYLH